MTARAPVYLRRTPLNKRGPKKMNYPRLQFTAPASASFDPNTGLLSISATPSIYREQESVAAFISVPKHLQLQVLVDPAGTFNGSPAGADLIVSGSIFGAGYSGDLLIGEVADFAYNDDPSATDSATITATLTGGSLLEHAAFEGGNVTITLSLVSVRDAADEVVEQIDWTQPWTARSVNGSITPA